MKLQVATLDNERLSKLGQESTKPRSILGEEAGYEMGFKIARLTVNVAKDLDIPYSKSEPPVVVSVEDGTPASTGGVRAGDVILDVNQTKVSSVKDVQKTLKKGPNILRVQRGEMVTLVYVETA